MIEIHRSLCMDKDAGDRLKGFLDFKKTLSEELKKIITLTGEQLGLLLNNIFLPLIVEGGWKISEKWDGNKSILLYVTGGKKII